MNRFTDRITEAIGPLTQALGPALEPVTEALGPNGTKAVGILVAYAAVCRGLRYLRRDTRHAALPYKRREDFSKMTADEAFTIVEYVHGAEFPFTATKALSFALFRTYGIPTISKLLCETQQFAKVEYAGRRYADTAILITEFMGHSPTSERATSAIARMNWLHGRYQKAGKISNDDLLYTLALFLLEPERWIRLYEWRDLTEMEIAGIGTHWKVVGEAMGIDYSCLRNGPNNFKDGYQFFEDIKEWQENYEKRVMLPNKYNHQLAEETTRILLASVPGFMKPFGKKLVVALLDDRLRIAMMYDAISPNYLRAIMAIFGVRKFLMNWFIPPRPWFMRLQTISTEADKNGRYFATEYDAQPWYVKPTFFERNSLLSWYRWAIGEPIPDGKNFKPEGYKIFEVGPKRLENQGHDECAATRDRLMSSKRGGCPFAV